MNKPNILLFFTDDQRFDTIESLGNDEIQTPNLDRLAKRGTVFTHAHIPGGSSGAVCMPSRAMLHTGRTLYHIQGEGQEVPQDHTLLGEFLQKQGYETYGIGKWHNGHRAYARSFTGGDEIFFGGMNDHWNVPAYHFDPTGQYDRMSPQIRTPMQNNHLVHWRCDHLTPGKHSTDLFGETAVNFLNNRKDDQPFFLYVSLMAPHDPRSMPEEFLKRYDPAKIKLPENFAKEHTIDTGALRIRDENLAAFPRDPDEVRRHIAEYYAMITHLDAVFGQVIEALEASGELENTIIIFAGDNGLAVGQHGLMGKQNLYDHSVRVPLIYAGPGVPEAKRSDALVYLLDIFPTLCDLLGTETPESVEGVSHAEAIRGEAAGRESMLLAYCDTIRGVSDGKYKLIEYACGATQLFDLQSDPYEMQNLAKTDEKAEILASMRVKLCDEWDDAEREQGKAFREARRDLFQ